MRDYSDLSTKHLSQLLRKRAEELPEQERSSLLQRRAVITDREDLLQLCQEFLTEDCLSKDPAEPPSNTSNSNANAPSSSQPKKTSSVLPEESVANMTPDQLRSQVRAMRMNPSAFSAMQSPPLSVDQVLQAANQMEQAANNPAMLQYMKDQMSKMSAEDLENLKRQNQRPGSAPGRSVSSEEQEVQQMLRVLQGDPAQARALVRAQPGMDSLSDEMIDQQLDTFRQLPPETLKMVLRASLKLRGYYQKVDVMSGGRGRYVVYLLAAVAVVVILGGLYLCWTLVGALWRLLTGSSTPPHSAPRDTLESSSGRASPVLDSRDSDEFEDYF